MSESQDIKTEVVVDAGGLWEGSAWTVLFNEEVTSHNGSNPPCKHGHSLTRLDERTEQWICPYAIVAWNEGGHNTTGVCLECVLERGPDIIKKV